MYFYASLFAAFVITLLVVSKIAEMLLAKRFNIGWVFLASLVGSAAAVASYFSLSIFVKGIDPMVMLIVSLSTMFIVSSAAFKYINKMSWTGAITTNIANIAVVLITLTAAVVLNGKSLEEEFSAINSVAKDNMSMVESAASNYQTGVVIEDVSMKDEIEGDELVMDSEDALSEEPVLEGVLEEAEPLITERDLLAPAAIKEIEKKEKVVYIEPKYRTISVGSIRSLVGQPIRILRKNGKVVAGSLKKINGSDAYVAQRLRSGVATTPISIAQIRKLEVYR